MNRHVDYDQVAPTYDGRYQRGGYSGTEQALLRFIGEQAPLQVLEAGCGTGHWLGIARAHGQRVIGLDFSAQMLSKARAALPGIELIHGRAESLPLPAESFDRIFCINAFHHFVDKPAFLAEARRLLRPGGGLFSVGLDPHDGTGQWYVYDYFKESLEIDQERFPPTSQLRECLRNAGFANCVTHEVDHWFLQLPAREILAQGRLEKAATSQLTVLTDEEYLQGMQSLEEDVQRAERKGETLLLTADLCLYGTYGSVPDKK